MSTTRTTLAIVAFAAMVSCTVKSPATTPTIQPSVPDLYATEATYSLMLDLAGRYTAARDQTAFQVRPGSLDTLLINLDSGEVDFLVSSHLPLDVDYWSAPLALDGLAIIVNPALRIADLSINDLRDIFSGRLRDWSAFGAESRAITPLSFHAGSDVNREFQRMVMGLASVTGNALLMPNFDAALSQVNRLEGAIAYLPLHQADNRVSIIAVDGVRPTAITIAEKRYPLRSTIYVIGREQPAAEAFTFFGWAQGEAGQAIVAEAYTALP